jgi:preprotein translocase subunit SecD
MKIINLLSILFLFTLIACVSGVKPDGQKVTFGICEIVKISEMPDSIIDTLKTLKVQIENNPEEPIIGFIAKTDTLALQVDLSNENLKLVRTVFTIDIIQKHHAVIAVRPKPVIDNSHIKNARAAGNTVVIYFTMEGARKWAELTKNNLGNVVVFVIDNQVYSMPVISAEIKNGVAVIQNLPSVSTANKISEALNSAIGQ